MGVVALAACTASTPTPSNEITPTPSPTAAPTTSRTATPSPSPSDDPGIGITPGKPFSAADILDAMRESRRPGGVPDVLETEAIAAAVADEIWTFDGEPWPSVVAGGSCGAVTCTLDLAGVPEGADAEDLWAFEITPSSGEVRVADATLRGLHAAVAEAAAAIVAESGADIGSDALLTSVRWLPPPDDGLLVLSYRTGFETGACGVDVTVDLRDRTVVDRAPVSC